MAERRQHAGVVGRVAVAQGPAPLPEAEDAQVLGGDLVDALVDGAEDLVAFVVGGQPDPVDEQLPHRRIAAVAGEDEVDRREHAGRTHPHDDVGAFRAAAASGVLGVAGGVQQGAVDVAGVRPVLVGEHRQHLTADHHVLVQRHRPVGGDDEVGLPADGGEPAAELLGVAHRRRQTDEDDRRIEVEDDLLPHRTAGRVGEEVHLVHDDVGEPVEPVGGRVDHVAQHLGRHDDDGGVPVDADVAGEQTDLFLTVAVDEVVVLLVAQGLDRRGVEAGAAVAQRLVDGEFPHHGLTGAGGGAHQDAPARRDRAGGLELEVVEGEGVVGGEGRDRIRGCHRCYRSRTPGPDRRRGPVRVRRPGRW